MAYTPRIRLYTKERLANGSSITLPTPQSHYLCNVMRQQTGNHISLFNGSDGEWEATITNAHKKHCEIAMTRQVSKQDQAPSIGLAYAPVKNIAQHAIIQKGTEMGVSDFYPVITDHTIIHKVNTDKLQANAIEAAEQCERLSIPTIHKAQPLAQFSKTIGSTHHLIFCDETGVSPTANTLNIITKDPIIALIGPEGGFSDKEHHELTNNPGVTSISMGPRILRADTAAIAALTLLQLHTGDWNQKPREHYE